jgi:hypothetical protein
MGKAVHILERCGQGEGIDNQLSHSGSSALSGMFAIMKKLPSPSAQPVEPRSADRFLKEWR